MVPGGVVSGDGTGAGPHDELVRQRDPALGTFGVEQQLGGDTALVADGLADGREPGGDSLGDVVEACDGDVEARYETSLGTGVHDAEGEHVAHGDDSGRTVFAVEDQCPGGVAGDA